MSRPCFCLKLPNRLAIRYTKEKQIKDVDFLTEQSLVDFFKAQGWLVFIFPLIMGLIFAFSYWHEKRRLLNGLLLNLFLLSFFGTLAVYAFMSVNEVAIVIVAILAVIFFLFLLFGTYGLLIFLLWNARQVWKRESHSLSNMLTLLLAAGILLFIFFYRPLFHMLPEWLEPMSSFIPLTLSYLILIFFNFLAIQTIYQFNHPRLNQDYIIVLGAGLLHGDQISRLLGNRIDAAIAFYQKQVKKSGRQPKLVMSGGKGADESVSEAAAMAAYAEKRGIPAADLLLEDRSTNTLENMKFSKQVIARDAGNKKVRAIFTTNNFHLFRAGMYARAAGLKANGIPAKTAFYYWPNAFLREFAAIVLLNKRRHLLVIGLIFLIDLLASATLLFTGAGK